jgi:hypothetical protein
MLRRREVIAWSIWALMMVWPLALLGTDREVREPNNPIASLEVQATQIDWRPKVEYERLALTVAGPGDFYFREEFEAGQAPQFSVVSPKGDRLPDGNYAYELRLVAQAGDDRAEDSLVQSGYLWVQGGSFVDLQADRHEPSGPGASASKPLLGISPFKDIVQNDDLVVKGHACIGPPCMAVAPGDPGLTLLEDQGAVLQIKFDANFSFHPTANDWALQANDPLDPNGENGDFMIRNSTFNTIPFRIMGGGTTANDSLTIFLNGNIGLGTRVPGAKLHVFGSATDDAFASAGPDPVSGPAFNFGYAGASFGRGAAFLNVRPDASATAPNPSLRFATGNVQRMIITNAGNVGIGTTNPGARLEVSGGEVRFPPGSGLGGFTHFNFSGDGKNYIRGITILADNGGSVGIGTATPSSKLHVNGGDIRVSGGSFIDDGVTLNAPDYVFEPSYKLMPLEELREFVTQEKHLPNVPNAREVKESGLNLSQFQMRLLEKVEELTLYTLTQDERLSSQQDELLRLREQNVLLQQRLAALEKSSPSEAPE